MTLGERDFAQLTEQADSGRTLSHSVYCDHCGYNLRYQVYVGRCPECGHGYNARSLVMQGIFTPQKVEFPLADGLLSIIMLSIGLSLLGYGIAPVQDWMLFGGAVFSAVGSAYLLSAWRKLRRFMRFYRVLRRIQDGEEE